MQKFADSYKLASVREKSPFRNVLNVAIESGSGIEVTKNYIRYQLGRKGANEMWGRTGDGGKKLAVALVEKIQALANDAKEIVESIGEIPESESRQRTDSTSSSSSHAALLGQPCSVSSLSGEQEQREKQLMFDKFQSRLILGGKVETLTAIRIGAGRSTSPISSDLPVVRDSANQPYIPRLQFQRRASFLR